MSSSPRYVMRQSVPMVNVVAARRRLDMCLRCEHLRGNRCAADRLPIGVHVLTDVRCKLERHDKIPLTFNHQPIGPASPLRIQKLLFKRRIAKFLNGVAGIYVAIRGSCLPPREVVEARRAACDTCEHRRALPPPIRTDICRKCSCVIAAKTLVATERCPVKKWAAVKTENCRDQRSLPIVGTFIKRNGGCTLCNANRRP